MKLRESLSAYGLLPAPSIDLRWADYRSIEEIQTFSHGLVVAKTNLGLAELSTPWLAIGPTASWPLHSSTVIISHGLVADAHYLWKYSETESRTQRWTCGLIEAMFRRWLNDNEPDLRDYVRRPIPLYNRWERS